MSDLDVALIVGVPIGLAGGVMYFIAELAQVLLDGAARRREARRKRRMLADARLSAPEFPSRPGRRCPGLFPEDDA